MNIEPRTVGGLGRRRNPRARGPSRRRRDYTEPAPAIQSAAANLTLRHGRPSSGNGIDRRRAHAGPGTKAAARRRDDPIPPALVRRAHAGPRATKARAPKAISRNVIVAMAHQHQGSVSGQIGAGIDHLALGGGSHARALAAGDLDPVQAAPRPLARRSARRTSPRSGQAKSPTWTAGVSPDPVPARNIGTALALRLPARAPAAHIPPAPIAGR